MQRMAGSLIRNVRADVPVATGSLIHNVRADVPVATVSSSTLHITITRSDYIQRAPPKRFI